MRLKIYILILTFSMIGCDNSKHNLITVKNNYEIELIELDSVRENLKGFWIREDKMDFDQIIWLEFMNNSNSTQWETITYNKENEKTKTYEYNTSAPFIELIKPNKKVQIEFTSLSGRDTVEIEQLTKTKLKIYGETYLKHKGYKFLKN